MALADRIRIVLSLMDEPKYGRQAKLAEIAKCGRPIVNHWLSGEQKSINSKHALAIADALGYRVEWLMDGKGPTRENQPAEVQPAREQEEEQPASSPAKAGNDLFLAHVTVDEMRLLTFCRTYPKAGKRFLELAIDLTGNPTME